jgi:hypothetical protein
MKRNTNTPLRKKEYDGEKVYTSNVSEIENVNFQHSPKS